MLRNSFVNNNFNRFLIFIYNRICLMKSKLSKHDFFFEIQRIKLVYLLWEDYPHVQTHAPAASFANDSFGFPSIILFFFFFFFSSHLSQTQFTYQYITRTRHSNFWNKCRTFNFTIFWKKVSNRQQVDAVFPLISLSPSYSSSNHHHHHGVRLLRVIYTTTSEGQKKIYTYGKKKLTCQKKKRGAFECLSIFILFSISSIFFVSHNF